jgi:hypothetical protein
MVRSAPVNIPINYFLNTLSNIDGVAKSRKEPKKGDFQGDQTIHSSEIVKSQAKMAATFSSTQ